MNSLDYVIAAVVVVYLTLSFLGTLKFKHWIFRACDYPRPQITLLGLICLALIFGLNVHGSVRLVLLILVGGFLIAQLKLILPYTRLWPVQVAKTKEGGVATLSAISANVLMSNRAYHRFVDLVKNKQPDLVVVLEGDEGWDEALKQLYPDYPHRICRPLDNRYGIHLFSRLELRDMKVEFLFSEEVPSIHGQVVLADATCVDLHCLHPEPPSPTEASDSLLRDAEILLVAERIKDCKLPSLLLGDLNDVAWSRTTRLFLQISGLLDPRIGRGFFNTFPAAIPFFRWSLDHSFHSKQFALQRIERLGDIGSDHFPIYIALSHQVIPQSSQTEADAEQIAEADKTVENAIERQKNEYSM